MAVGAKLRRWDRGVCVAKQGDDTGLDTELERWAPAELRAARLRVGNDELVVFSVPFNDAPALPDVLSAAERDVASLLVRGLSNDDIARRRGTSARTVANQVAAILRKLGVRSRVELITRLVGCDVEPAP